MSYEMVVGLHVTDEIQYEKYRVAMKPILSTYGGSFGFDGRVSEVLSAGVGQNVNRIFFINFPDVNTKDRFFADPDYLSVKEVYFSGSVDCTLILSCGDKNALEEIGS